MQKAPSSRTPKMLSFPRVSIGDILLIAVSKRWGFPITNFGNDIILFPGMTTYFITKPSPFLVCVFV